MHRIQKRKVSSVDEVYHLLVLFVHFFVHEDHAELISQTLSDFVLMGLVVNDWALVLGVLDVLELSAHAAVPDSDVKTGQSSILSNSQDSDSGLHHD